MLYKNLFYMVFIIFITSAGSATGAEPSTVYPGITWNVSLPTAAGFPADCNKMQLDVAGAFGASTQFLAYGQLKCAGGSYMLDGNGYIGATQTVMVLKTMDTQWSCLFTTATLVGSCKIIAASSLATYGTATIAP